ncbi:hypothetical protein AAVH_07375 [Aphelenchoides avenae]|nr:hypothetical protein AAVH_07375 [Aphelenchus avenae]
MSKLPHDSQAPEPASEGLVKRLKAAANDAELLREVIESSDIASVSAALVVLLAGADRDTLDAMQLVCSFLLKFIRERELTQLALRSIWRVDIGNGHTPVGRTCEPRSNSYEGWLPTIGMQRYRRAEDLAPNTIHSLTSYLRMAFCDWVYISVDAVADTSFSFGKVWGMVFDDLAAPSTFVDILNMNLPLCRVELALRGIVAFKSVGHVYVDSLQTYADQEPLSESFFVPAAEHGVRYINHISSAGNPAIQSDTAAAISFGFANPLNGGDRCLIGIDCAIGADFLAQVKQKASELREAGHVDFNFEFANVSSQVDSCGFEKYRKDDGRTWLMNDLQNHVNVEVKQTGDRIEIHVFSSA